MNSGCRHIISTITFLLAFFIAHAQISVRTSVDRDKILIGEPIELIVEAYTPLGASVNWFGEDSIPHFEVVSRSRLDTIESIDGKKVIQRLIITSFDSGRWQIPAFQVNVEGQSYFSDTTLSVGVGYVPFDAGADYRDIKQIIETDNPSLKYLPWIIAAVALICFAGFIFLIRKRKPPAGKPKPVVHTIVSPYDEAMQAIEELKQKGVTEGQEKIFYTEVNDILRKYMARKFAISTVEKTNDELIGKIADLNLPKDNLFKLAQSLRMGDFVKFARYRPEQEDNKVNLDTLRVSIEILDNNYVGVV
jgi:BatD DUF11 like domain